MDQKHDIHKEEEQIQNQEQEDDNEEERLSYDTDKCSLLLQQESEPTPPPPPPPIVEDDAEGLMLGPDHPLLVKFQESLKQQLLRQKEQLKVEVFELETDISKKTVERDKLGVTVYDAQQIVALQYESIDQYENEIKKFIEDRQEIEEEVVNTLKSHKEIHEKLLVVEKKEVELGNEVDTMNFMYSKMVEWEDKLKSDLAVHKRITDKSKIDKKQFAEEKRNLDFLIYKLMTEIFRLENSLENLNMQLKIKEKERETFATSISNANIDIEALEFEHKRLVHSWNCVLVAIGHRDKTYDTAKKELEKEQEGLQNTLVEISSMKKLSNGEMTKNEQLTLIKGRFEMEKVGYAAKITHEVEKLTIIEKKLMETQSILLQTNKDVDEILNVKRLKMQDLTEIQKEIEKYINMRVEIEEKVLVMLQEQISSDKVSNYMNKTIRDIREENRTMEIQLASIENKNADLQTKMEQQKMKNDGLLKFLDELLKQEKEQEAELNVKNKELKQVVLDIKKNLIKFDEASKKYEETLNRTGIEMTPTEVKIKELEKSIQDFDEKNGKLKSFWLTQQRYIVSLREDRHKQLSEKNLIEKQIMLLQQKNLRLEEEMDEFDHQSKRYEKDMTNMKFKIDKINSLIWDKRGEIELIETMNDSIKRDNILKLQDAELSCIKLEDKLTELAEEKCNLTKDLFEMNRETLAWERKVKLAYETKQTIKEEKSNTGEIGNMKAEIHRMNVRYGQLRKAQDKLVQDLNHCLSRREFIFVNAVATEKRLAIGGKVHNRINLKRKFDNIKLKIKKTINDNKDVEDKLSRAYHLEKELYDKINDNDRAVEEVRSRVIEIVTLIDTEKFSRQKELEELVYKQHKLRSYTSISKGLYRPQYRMEQSLKREYSEQQKKNKKLQTVVENLIIDFPAYYPVFAKILNTLKIVFICKD